MNAINTAELRRLAEAAKKYDDCTKIDHWDCTDCKEKADCYDLERQYVNEIKKLINNPTAIIAILDSLSAAEAVAEQVGKTLNASSFTAGYENLKLIGLHGEWRKAKEADNG